MPMPNEHSARLRDPDDFDAKTYRRTDGGTIYGKIKVPKTISIIWAKLKGKAKPSDPPLPQALRFPTKNWTADKAKQWLKTNGIKYQSFEPASGESKADKHTLASIDGNTAPCQACVFAEAEFTKGSNDGQNKKTFSIVGYSGRIIEGHWYWGNIAFDLTGMKFAKKNTPVLEEHFTNRRIGFATKQEITDKVTFEGEFLDNQVAQELAADMTQGFPMEASLFIPPTVIEQVQQGETVEVNGQKLKGPGAVFRKSLIKEVSMCVFGMDSNTISAAHDQNQHSIKFSMIKENDIMGKETEQFTVETFAEQYPEIYSVIVEQARNEGHEMERQSFADLEKACGDDSALLVNCYKQNQTSQQALEQRLAKLENENKQLQDKMSKAKGSTVPDPAYQEFSDSEQKQKERESAVQKTKPFMTLVTEHAAEHKCSRAQAVEVCATLYPDAHQKMRDGKE